MVSVSEGNLSIFSQTLQADLAQQMKITLTQLKNWFKNRNAKKRKTGNKYRISESSKNVQGYCNPYK